MYTICSQKKRGLIKYKCISCFINQESHSQILGISYDVKYPESFNYNPGSYNYKIKTEITEIAIYINAPMPKKCI